MKSNVTRTSLMNCFVLCIASVAAVLAGATAGFCDDGWGSVDGAIWRVTLTPQVAGRGPNAEKALPMTGRYRVEKLVLYQAENRQDKELGRKIGKSTPVKGAKKPTTIVEFTDFLVHNRDKGVHVKMSGKARLVKEDKEQKAKGIFVEGEEGGGWRWDMEIVRVRE